MSRISPLTSARILVRQFPRGFAAGLEIPKQLVFQGTPKDRQKLLAEIYAPYFGHLKRHSPEWYRASETARAWRSYYKPFDSTVDFEWQRQNRPRLENLDYWSSRVPFSLSSIEEGFRAALSHQSVQIEGNRLTLGDSLEIFHRIKQQRKQSSEMPSVESLLDGNPRLERLQADVIQLRNNIVAQEVAMKRFGDPNSPLFSEGDIKELHATLLRDLVSLPTPGGLEGVYTTPRGVPLITPPGEYRLSVCRSEGCEMTVYPYPLEIPDLMSGLVDWGAATFDRRELHPFLAACRFYATFLHIHPFGDGNGRVGRVLFNLLALRFGYKPLYLQHINREEYIDALFRATSHKQPEKWFSLAVDNTIEALRLIVENEEGI